MPLSPTDDARTGSSSDFVMIAALVVATGALDGPCGWLTQEAAAQTRSEVSEVAPLPEPTGPFPVGTQRFWWTDESREEGATAVEGDHRELYVQVYDPRAAASEDLAPSAYFRNLPAYGDTFEPELLDRLRRTTVHTTAGGPVAASARGFPVVLFVHGWQAQSDAYSAVMSDISSHGFVVAAIDQPYQGRIALRTGGVTVASENHFGDPMAMVGYYGAESGRPKRDRRAPGELRRGARPTPSR